MPLRSRSVKRPARRRTSVWPAGFRRADAADPGRAARTAAVQEIAGALLPERAVRLTETRQRVAHAAGGSPLGPQQERPEPQGLPAERPVFFVINFRSREVFALPFNLRVVEKPRPDPCKSSAPSRPRNEPRHKLGGGFPEGAMEASVWVRSHSPICVWSANVSTRASSRTSGLALSHSTSAMLALSEHRQ